MLRHPLDEQPARNACDGGNESTKDDRRWRVRYFNAALAPASIYVEGEEQPDIDQAARAVLEAVGALSSDSETLHVNAYARKMSALGYVILAVEPAAIRRRRWLHLVTIVEHLGC